MPFPTRVAVAVVGAGAVGSSVAYHLARAGIQVHVLEKEAGPAFHQSGRSSGVIHAGYNLKPGSLKAQYCVEGAKQLRSFCADHGVAVRTGGILVVARNEAQAETLDELAYRARANGVQARLVDDRGLREIEPHASGTQALHAPEGASFDAAGYVRALVGAATAAGAAFAYRTRVQGVEEEKDELRIRTSRGSLRAQVLVNAAGLHADRVAGDLARDYRIIPFRGYYAELVPRARALVRSHIYGVPDLALPFLGVHLSRRHDDRVTAGPGAMLAFGREAYSLPQVNARDLWDTVTWPGLWKLLRRPLFRRLMRAEVDKSLRLRAIWKEVRSLVPALRARDLVRGSAGNRAQVVDRQGLLVEDMAVRKTSHAIHVLNAVSPGLTASLPFGQHIAAEAKRLL